MKTIPDVRKELLQLAETRSVTPYAKAKIQSLVKSLYRRKSVRRAAKESQPMTEALAKRIRQAAKGSPNAPYMDLANRFNVATGRISEALAGKRAA